MEFQECGGAFELSRFVAAAVGLEFAEVVQRLLELAGEAMAVEAEGGERGD
jgi:hypothetical protein